MMTEARDRTVVARVGGSGKRQLADGLAHSPSAKPSVLPLPPVTPHSLCHDVSHTLMIQSQ